MGLFSKQNIPDKEPAPEFITVGQIVNTHGVRGEVKVQPWDVDAAQFCKFKTLYIDGVPVRPTARRVQGEMVLMTLPTVETMDEAEKLKTKLVDVRRSEVRLPDGQYFDAELVGMHVYEYFPRRFVGVLEEVQSYPAHKLYKVRGESRCYLIPAVENIFIVDIDERKREIYVNMMEGLACDED